MHTTNEITVVLKARAGESTADLAPFLKPGGTVLVGRSGAIVSAVSAGDKITHAEQLENQVLIAESAMRLGVQLPAGVEEFGSMHIDDRIRMVVNAKRYERLANADLDSKIDEAMRRESLEEPQPCAG